MRTAEPVLDIYDDFSGKVLARYAAGRMGEKLASSRLLDQDELARIPDRLFAYTHEGQRKYAVHDEPHLVTSMIYFMDRRNHFPEDTRTKVARNLVTACGWYGVTPPPSLLKVAMGPVMGLATAGLGAMDMSSRAKEHSDRARNNMDELRKAQASGMKVGHTKQAAGYEYQYTPEQEHAAQNGNGTAPASALIDRFLPKKRKEVEAAMADSTPQLDPVMSVKKADLSGTEIMPRAATSRAPGKPGPSDKMTVSAKISELLGGQWHADGMSGASVPSSPPPTKTASHYALPDRKLYPIETASQVKRAERYFDDYLYEFRHDDRRAFAQSVVTRAGELGVKCAGRVLDYAGTEYGPFIQTELHARVNSFVGTQHEDVYLDLLEKQSSMTPDAMVAALKLADSRTGVDSRYERPATGMRDPYRAVYGKVAAEDGMFTWASGQDYTNSLRLQTLCDRGYDTLSSMFGKDFAQSFQKDPVGIFKSLPDPEKVVLARLAATA